MSLTHIYIIDTDADFYVFCPECNRVFNRSDMDMYLNDYIDDNAMLINQSDGKCKHYKSTEIFCPPVHKKQEYINCMIEDITYREEYINRLEADCAKFNCYKRYTEEEFLSLFPVADMSECIGQPIDFVYRFGLVEITARGYNDEGKYTDELRENCTHTRDKALMVRLDSPYYETFARQYDNYIWWYEARCKECCAEHFGCITGD